MSNDEQLIKPVKNFMIIAGMWVFPFKKSTPHFTRFYYWYSWIFQAILVLFLILLFLKLLQLLSIHSNMQVIWSVIAMLISIIAVFCKVVIYQWNKVPVMFQEVIEKEKQIWLCQDEDMISLYKKNIKICKRIIYGLILYVIFVMGVLFTFGLLGLSKNISCSKSVKEQLETSFVYPIWLPFLENEHKVAVVIIDIIIGWVALVLYNVNYMIFVALIFCAISQFQFLGIKIANLNYNSPDLDDEIRKLIDDHICSITFVERINGAIKNVVFVDFLLNSFNVASVAIQVINSETSSDLIFPLAYLVVLVLQVFALGWLADEIKVQSLAVGDLLYFSKWYNLSQTSKILIKTMITRAQKSSDITIGPFGAMTTGTALKTMRAAYSYITLMQTISK